MKIGKVIGTVVCSVKDERLSGLKLLVVQEHEIDGQPKKAFHVAADTVQAGGGETILLATGSSARQTDTTTGKAIDCAIIGVVDSVNLA